MYYITHDLVRSIVLDNSCHLPLIWFGLYFFFSSRRRHTRYWRDWSSDVCSSDLDLGTGNAAIPLFLSLRTTAQIYGLEIQKVSYELAAKNIALNHLEEQVYILHGDMKNWDHFFSKNSFDIVVSNPPFFEFHGNKALLNDLDRSEEHTSELQSRQYLVCRLLLEKKKKIIINNQINN